MAGDAAFYATPQMRLNAGASYSNAENLFVGGDVEGWSAGVGAEYQFANSPFSVTGTYQRVSSDFANVDIDEDVFMIGARYNFGGTLQSLDRAGANLGRTLAGLPSVLSR
ncbi:hypothetical protein D3C81_1835600 [compost metagenome]